MRRAIANGWSVRPAGAGHSFTPIVTTGGRCWRCAACAVSGVDGARRLVTALPGTTVAEFGDPLWAAGLALANQGDIDAQAIAGAIATGTHGSGERTAELLGHAAWVPARRRPRRDGRDRPGRSRTCCGAAQVAIGLLGVMTRRDDRGRRGLQAERGRSSTGHSATCSPMGRAVCRSPALLVLLAAERGLGRALRARHPARSRMTDTCYIKRYDEAGEDVADDATTGRRVDRSYRIYPGRLRARLP